VPGVQKTHGGYKANWAGQAAPLCPQFSQSNYSLHGFYLFEPVDFSRLHLLFSLLPF